MDGAIVYKNMPDVDGILHIDEIEDDLINVAYISDNTDQSIKEDLDVKY